MLAIDIAEASAKLRQGPPLDDEEDYRLPILAGTLDFASFAAQPNPDPRLAAGIAVPPHAIEWQRPRRLKD